MYKVHMLVVPAAIEGRDAAGYHYTSSQREIERKESGPLPLSSDDIAVSDVGENTLSNMVYRSSIANAGKKKR